MARDGQKVREIDWPPNCLLASVRKGRKIEIPHGDTELAAGNILVIDDEEGSGSDMACSCRADGDQ